MTRTLSLPRAVVALLALLTAIAALVAAPPASAQDAEADVPIERISGANRVQTAIEIAGEAFPEGADTVVIARPDSYADALAGGPLATALNAPILLARTSEHLDDGVMAEIDRLGAADVVILGGDQAVLPEVADALAAGHSVERIEGSDRFATAQAVAQRLDDEADVTQAVIVKGRDADPNQGFADAVSASWWAGQQGYAILPVRETLVPEGTVETLTDIGAAGVYVVGGEAAVSGDVVTALEGAGVTITDRLGGANRFETSALVWDTAVAQGANPVERWVATGAVFADALSAAPAVALAGHTFVLVPPEDFGTIGLAAGQVLANSPEYLQRIVILGGENAVASEVESDIATLVTDDLPAANYCLTVLHNNDGESQLVAASGAPDFGGVARFESVVERERQLALDGFTGDGCEERQVITLNSGDNFLAGPEIEASRANDDGTGPVEGFDPWYDVLALDAIGYDAFAIGNHEFDFGPETLAEFIGDFGDDATFVSANLDFTGVASLQDLADADTIVPSLMVEKGSRTIGVVGATTPRLPTISSPGGVTVEDIDATIATVNEEAAQLRSDGADIVILISHLQNIVEDFQLIDQTSDVDIAIAGGGDELLGEYGNLYVPGDGSQQLPLVFEVEDEAGDTSAVAGTYPAIVSDADDQLVPVVTTTGEYRYVGRLRARFDADSDFIGVDPRRSRLIRVAGPEVEPDGVEPDASIQSDVVDPVQDYLDSLETLTVATTPVQLNGVRNDVRTQETNLGDLLTDAYIYVVNREAAEFGVDTTNPFVALTNGGGIRNDSLIPSDATALPYELTAADVNSIAPFANNVGVFEDMDPATLKTILEHAYSGLPAVEGRFGQIAGMTVTVDVSETAQVVEEGAVTIEGARVRHVELDDGTVLIDNGEVVDSSTMVNFATIDFLAAGGDGYPFPTEGFTIVGVNYGQALRDYLVEEDGLGGSVPEAQYPLGGVGRIEISG